MLSTHLSPLIIGFVADLMFTTRIETTAERLGFRVEWVEQAGQIAPADPDSPKRQPAEHLVGPGAALLEIISRKQPALILFDLGNSAVPWRDWVALIKSVPATRRIPVVCYGSHVDSEAFQAARGAGADAVMARSRFTRDLPQILTQYAQVPDYEALAADCQGALSRLALEGLEAFNHGEYFEAHELLEEAWNEEEGPARELYRAILQVAVAYLQIERGNYRGAVKMFLRVRQWIDPMPDECRGVNVALLRDQARAVHAALMQLEPERIEHFDRSLFLPVEYRRPA
jgi:predicted metal-dependent hydrolase